jgi:hypothetical protein
MVETVSDPAGLGWIHSGDIANGDVFDFNQNYDQGELGDICSALGAFPAAGVPFALSPALISVGLPNDLTVSPYYSDQDNSCEPISIMNDVIEPLAGSPSIRFTANVHNLQLNLNQISPPPGIIDSLEVDIITGGDNLNSSSSADIVIAYLSLGQTLTLSFPDVNEGAEWANDSFHAIFINLPPGLGLGVSDIKSVTLHTNFGGLTPDNWNVAGIEVQMNVNVPSGDSCEHGPFTLVDTTKTMKPQLLGDGSQGLFRFKGGSFQPFSPLRNPVPTAIRKRIITGLFLKVGTGTDDLRGGNSPGDNVDAVVTVAGSGPVVFPNVNQNLTWPSNSPTQLIELTGNTIPPSTILGDITSLSIQTNLPGGSFGDNWDLTEVQLVVGLGCIQKTPPAIRSLPLAARTGSTIQDDGWPGLCRETGQQHDCRVPIPAPPGIQTSDPIDSITVTVSTGHDDLRGSSWGTDDANAVIGGQTFADINSMQSFPNGATRGVTLVPTLPMTVADVVKSGIDVSTQFGGGLGGDNWDIVGITVSAMITVGPGQVQKSVHRSMTRSFSPRQPWTPSALWLSAAAHSAPRGVPVPSPWMVVPSPNSGAGNNVLNGVACVTPVDCFAAGYEMEPGGTTEPLLEKETAGVWMVQPSPATGEQYGALSSVSCLSLSYCVAVGYAGSGGAYGNPGISHILLETWDGLSWSVTMNASPSGDVLSGLRSVSCASSDGTCAAVGFAEGSQGVTQTLAYIEHDQVWLLTPSDDTPGDNVLHGVSCTGFTHCVAVGTSNPLGLAQTLIETWDGNSWTINPSVNASQRGNVLEGMGGNVLYAVSCYDSIHCVAVGAYIDPQTVPQALIESNVSGQDTWAIPSGTSPGSGGSVLTGVSCPNPVTCSAVGFESDGTTNRTLNENFNGSVWFVTPTPSPGLVGNFLTSVSCATPISCAGAGDFGDIAEMNRTLVLNFIPTVPNEPTSAVAIAGDSEASISFTAPSDNGGRFISSFTVTAIDSTNAANGGQVASDAASPVQIGGLTNGDSYTFTVTATNGIGTGPASAPSNSVTPLGVPSAPTGVMGAATGNHGEVTLSWTAPALYSIDTYHVTPSPACPLCTGLTTSGKVPTGTSTIIKGLTDGTSYSFSVSATNGSGTGPSGVSGAIVPATAPGVPTSVTAIGGYATIQVNWKAASNHGSAILSYTATATPTDATAPISAAFGGSFTTGRINGLSNTRHYNVTVVATNKFGSGLPGTAIGNPISPSATAAHITTSPTATVGVGQPFSLVLSSAGTPSPKLTASGLHPLWLKVGAGVTPNTVKVSGTAPKGSGGQYSLALSASNGVGVAALQTFTLSVLEITSLSQATLVLSQLGSFTVNTVGSASPPSIHTSSLLPAGILLYDHGNGTGAFAGVAGVGTAKVWSILIVATLGSGTTHQMFTLTVHQLPAFTSKATVGAAVGHALLFHVTATGFPAPKITVTSALPAWLKFVGPTATIHYGRLSGTPPPGSGGAHVLSFSASNGVSPMATQIVTLSVLEFTSANSVSFPRNKLDSFTVTTSNSPPPVTLTTSSALPPGVKFKNNGAGTATISGTPTGPATTYLVVVTATAGTLKLFQNLSLKTT